MHIGSSGLRKPAHEIIASVANTISSQLPEGAAGYYAVQLGASEPRRQWPTSSFAAVGQYLWEAFHLCPVLLGTANENVLVSAYASAAQHPFLSFCGKTNFEELAATLLQAKMLITNDTGTMHLAAGYNIPILAIFLATAQPFDTGPYCEGSCSLEADLPCHPCSFGVACPHNLACHSSISAETVTQLAASYLTQGQWNSNNYAGARVWVAKADTAGFMRLDSISGHNEADRTQWIYLQRQCLCQFLDTPKGQVFTAHPIAPIVLSKALQQQVLSELLQLRGLLEVFEQQGNLLLMRPLPPIQEKFMATWNRVLLAFKQNPYLSALAVIWLEATQADGQELPHIIQHTKNFHTLLSLYISAIS